MAHTLRLRSHCIFTSYLHPTNIIVQMWPPSDPQAQKKTGSHTIFTEVNMNTTNLEVGTFDHPVTNPKVSSVPTAVADLTPVFVLLNPDLWRENTQCQLPWCHLTCDWWHLSHFIWNVSNKVCSHCGTHCISDVEAHWVCAVLAVFKSHICFIYWDKHSH